MGMLLRPWRHYADFKGRSRRFEFLLFHLQIWAVLAAILCFGAPAPSAGREAVEASVDMMMALALPVLVAAAIPALAVTVRRLHDCDLSAWYLVSVAVPLLFSLLTLYLLIQSGSEGHNSYGPDPRAEGPAIDLERTFE